MKMEKLIKQFKEELKAEIMQKANDKDWNYIGAKLYTNHLEDIHLYIVLVKNQKEEYVTYLYNAYDGGFSSGKYFDNYDKAYYSFCDRGHLAYDVELLLLK